MSRAAQAPAAAAQQYLMIARASIRHTQITRVHPSPALRRSHHLAWQGLGVAQIRSLGVTARSLLG